MYVCVYVCVYIYIYICIHTHISFHFEGRAEIKHTATYNRLDISKSTLNICHKKTHHMSENNSDGCGWRDGGGAEAGLRTSGMANFVLDIFVLLRFQGLNFETFQARNEHLQGPPTNFENCSDSRLKFPLLIMNPRSIVKGSLLYETYCRELKSVCSKDSKSPES